MTTKYVVIFFIIKLKGENYVSLPNFDIHSSDLNKLINYMKNNLEAIEFWSDPVYCGTFTETFVQQLVKSYFVNAGK